jgi:hypothetical protein
MDADEGEAAAAREAAAVVIAAAADSSSSSSAAIAFIQNHTKMKSYMRSYKLNRIKQHLIRNHIK